MKLGSIEKCVQIIDLLSKNMHGLRLSEIAAELDLPPSSLHHILNTLQPHGFISQNPGTKTYALGLRFLEIGRRILDHFDIRTIAKDHLRKLHEACGQTVHLAVLRDRKVIYIDKVGTPVGLSLATYVGYATDPHAAAGGKVLLSELSEREINNIYPTGKLEKFAPKTIATVPALLSAIKEIRQQGFAMDDEEYYEGVRCVSAPIRAGRKIVAALSITGSIFAMTDEKINNEYKKLLLDTPNRISSELKW